MGKVQRDGSRKEERGDLRGRSSRALTSRRTPLRTPGTGYKQLFTQSSKTLGSIGNNVSHVQYLHREEQSQVKDSNVSEKGDNSIKAIKSSLKRV